MRFFHIYLFLISFLMLSACDKIRGELSGNKNDSSVAETDSLLKSKPIIVPVHNPLKTRKLKLLIANNINTYFLYKGEIFGLEYELLSLFLKSKHIELEIELIKDVEHIRDSLHAHGAHMAAATFIKPVHESSSVLFSDPIYTTDIVLVKHKDNPKPASKPVVIRNAPYVDRINHLDKNKLQNLSLTYSQAFTSRHMLLQQVHSKEIESTIADANETALVYAFCPDIRIESVLEKDAPVVFMFHSEMDTLQAEFNQWLKKKRNTSDYQWIILKYKSLPKKISNQLTLTPTNASAASQKISSYDKIIKQYSATIDWDWRLVASLIHQESKFDPSIQSWAGACGLMQVTPRTALSNSNISKSKLFIPSYNIKAGTQYIHWLEHNFFNDSRISKSEKQKLILASYNAGAGHVTDAQALCVKHHLNPYVWEGNVEKMILAKSQPKYYHDPVCKHGYCHGQETSTYVKNILFYYKNYSSFFKE